MFVFTINPSNRNIKYTPAVTRVDEWTRDDTGVGAAIAAGNHALNGIWALLVKDAKIIQEHKKGFIYKKLVRSMRFREGYIIKKAIDPIIRASPTRLLINVNIPEL